MTLRKGKLLHPRNPKITSPPERYIHAALTSARVMVLSALRDLQLERGSYKKINLRVLRFSLENIQVIAVDHLARIVLFDLAQQLIRRGSPQQLVIENQHSRLRFRRNPGQFFRRGMEV